MQYLWNIDPEICNSYIIENNVEILSRKRLNFVLVIILIFVITVCIIYCHLLLISILLLLSLLFTQVFQKYRNINETIVLRDILSGFYHGTCNIPVFSVIRDNKLWPVIG